MNKSLIDFSGIYRADSNNIKTESLENLGLVKTIPQSNTINYQGGIYIKIERVGKFIGIGTQYQAVELRFCPISEIKELPTPIVISSLISLIQVSDNSIKGLPVSTEILDENSLFKNYNRVWEFNSIKDKKNKVTKMYQIGLYGIIVADTYISATSYSIFDRVHRYDIPRKIKKVLDLFFDGKTDLATLNVEVNKLNSFCQ